MALRPGLPWKQTNYGRRGGASPTAGIRFSIYRITYPDRTGDRKQTAKARMPTAKAVCWQDETGAWHNSGVFDDLPTWAHKQGRNGPYTIVEAERIG